MPSSASGLKCSISSAFEFSIRWELEFWIKYKRQVQVHAEEIFEAQKTTIVLLINQLDIQAKGES